MYIALQHKQWMFTFNKWSYDDKYMQYSNSEWSQSEHERAAYTHVLQVVSVLQVVQLKR